MTTVRESREETAGIIFLMMKDQLTHESFGTFCAWTSDYMPGITQMMCRQLFETVQKQFGALTEHQEAFLWRCYGTIRRTTDQRKGQALFNALEIASPENASRISGTGADCFYDDYRIRYFLEALGMTDFAGYPIKLPQE